MEKDKLFKSYEKFIMFDITSEIIDNYNFNLKTIKSRIKADIGSIIIKRKNFIL